VKGAAIATVISQFVSAIWVLTFLTKKSTLLKIEWRKIKFNFGICKKIASLGISPFIMQSTESAIFIIFNSSLQRYGGDIYVAVMTIMQSLMQLCLCPLQGFTSGIQPIISYNYGANNKERVKEAFFTQFGACVIYTSVFWAALMFVPQIFAGMFTNDVALIEYTTWTLRIYMAGIFALGFQISCQQSFMALGQAKVSLLLACLRKIILLIPLIFILPVFFENKVFAVFLAEPVSDIIAAAVTTITFLTQFNRILKKEPR
jgi:Na+-driven multidrug efflux pump